ncbi:MAG TPA: SbcC/MukB-like Walker B domain-containing protein [Candidatus Baltobacteraceae bacterium]|jgi:DNA repair exonuclease SbcCD ATPase subunit|nr:SbcC/MukB-like Walker B domain-containing protein [Candidatus Baltobacteraceae bacterium]
MTRTIRLTRIHALNWYGYKDSIPVEGNLLLAGVTGSGKSILMDLVQLVLIGDQRLVRFNQSATGDRSDRSLKGYCLGDTKQEENGVTQYMRQSAISYVALEFTWPNGKRAETWGLRIEFASAAEVHGKVTPFFLPLALVRGDFLHPDKRPLDYPAFKAFVESKEGRLYSEGLEPYLRDMAQPAHLNFDRAVLRALLPTAMSFTFLKSFNEFARNFILPTDKLDVSDVTASYRTFVRYEEDLKLLDDQYQKLKAIRDTFTRWTELRRDRALARYLEAQLRHEHSAEQLVADEAKLEKLKAEYGTEEARLRELDDKIPELQRQISGLAATINETPEGRLYSELKSRNEKLARQISQLSEIGNSLKQALGVRLRNARAWLKELRPLPLEMDAVPINNLERAIHSVEDGGVAKAGETLQSLGAAAQAANVAASRAAGPTLKRLGEIRQSIGQLRDEIAALTIGKLPFSTRLLDALNNSLLSRGLDLPARHLRELCEVADERWRPAIEVAFARKFAVVVAVEHYDQAEKIYHSLKASDLGGDAGRESLVNPTKALQRRKPVRPGSLAEKLKASHPVAESVISEAFGSLMCVERREDLREHDFAIMPDGFSLRGAFVERSRFYDGNPFVGKKGLEQQLAWKEKQRADLEVEQRKLIPVERAVNELDAKFREYFQIAPNLYSDLAETKKLPELKDELDENIKKLNRIDRAKFDELARDQAKLEKILKTLETEQRGLLQSEKRADLRRLEGQIATARDEVKKLDEKFGQIRDETDVSAWLKRLEEWRSEMLSRFPAKDVAANRFNEQFHNCDRDAAASWEDLKAKRRELGAAHSKFNDLPVESDNNEAHGKQLAKLEESEIPEYRGKAERERKNWESLFRTQVLEKLHTALHEVVNLITLLNTSLRKRPIGTNTYELRYRRNPDYQLYHELLEASAVAREDDLFFASADQRFRDAINHFLKTLTETPDGAEAARLLDYRHYYEYDMEVVEADGRKTSVDRHSGKFSGGENQSPYFIAILASYLRAYRRYTSRKAEPSLGLVPIDEAFSKLSGERIKDCITALQAFDLQGVFSMSTGNIPYAFEHCDWLVVVSKDERCAGKRIEIRNIPVSLARDSDDAQRLMST